MGARRAAQVAARLGVGAGLTLTLASCTGDSTDPPGPEPTTTQSTSPATPAGGPSDAPAPAEPETRLLDWQPLDGPATSTLTRVGDQTVAVNRAQSQVEVTGPSGGWSLPAPRGFRYVDVLADSSRLVAVAQDNQEQEPARATVVDLATREQQVVDGSSDVPTISGGTWALGQDQLLHATYDARGRYCLATVDLAAGTSSVGYCAPKRVGFSSAIAAPAGTSMLTFAGQPQCRTPVRVDGASVTPLEGVASCTGWDSVLTPTGAVWSVVKNQNRVEQGEFYARTDSGYVDLGVGTTGTLTWCGDSAYFVRDSQRDSDQARLLRWTPEGTLEVVYETPGKGNAFLAEPRCAGDALSLSAFSEGGDEAVWATVPTDS